MTDMMSTLRGFLGDNADEKIGKAMEMLKSSGMLDSGGSNNIADKTEDGINTGSSKISKPQANFPSFTPESLEMIGQIKGMFDRVTTSNDSRSNLLISLKPFMRPGRQRSIDRVTKMMNIARFSGIFKG